jgi:hypothetical protein
MTSEARRVVQRWLRYPRLRGSARPDGKITLLTVNYRSERDVLRLVSSFRRFVSSEWPIVIVQNSGFPLEWRVRGARVVSVGSNLHHGLGLDFGLRFVSTEYVLICDPDTMIVGDLWSELRPRLQRFGVAGIDISAPFYHPICLAFRTELWKESTVSMREDWSRGFDVGRALTPLLGGVQDGALLPRTRSAGPPIQSWRADRHHYVAEVYADVVTNTLGGTRAAEGPGAFGEEEGPYDEIVRIQQLWRDWADAYLVDRSTLDEFPSKAPTERTVRN